MTITTAAPDINLSDRLPETLAEIRARFAPIFERIARGAVHRERERELPFEAVRELREAGFGALRLPVEYGGAGLRLGELFDLLIDLGAADSNLPQLLRGHIAFIETWLVQPESPRRREWFQAIGRREILFGNAQAERGATSDQQTEITEVGGALAVTGTKYYSTGTLFADWIWSAARFRGRPVAFAIRADTPGITRIDDWDGFGQRLTGSGTTIYDGARVDPENILDWDESAESRPTAYTTGLYQAILLASLAGISRATKTEAIDFVRPRTRTFGKPGSAHPREDVLVQSVIGEVASLNFVVEAAVRAAIAGLEAADAPRAEGIVPTEAAYERALIGVFETQQVVIELTLRATTRLFEVGGASATAQGRALDRLWRNARTISSHNPAIHRAAALGDHYLNGTGLKSPIQLAREASEA